ncbi:hypothetical protein P5V15_008302 [Pogonomyrmex californicus]
MRDPRTQNGIACLVTREKRQLAQVSLVSEKKESIHYVQLAGKAARRILTNSSGRRSEPTERSRSCEKRICDACRRTSARRSPPTAWHVRARETTTEKGWEKNEEDRRVSALGEQDEDAQRVLQSGVAGGWLGGLYGGDKKVGVGSAPVGEEEKDEWGRERQL